MVVEEAHSLVVSEHHLGRHLEHGADGLRLEQLDGLEVLRRGAAHDTKPLLLEVLDERSVGCQKQEPLLGLQLRNPSPLGKHGVPLGEQRKEALRHGLARTHHALHVLNAVRLVDDAARRRLVARVLGSHRGPHLVGAGRGVHVTVERHLGTVGPGALAATGALAKLGAHAATGDLLQLRPGLGIRGRDAVASLHQNSVLPTQNILAALGVLVPRGPDHRCTRNLRTKRVDNFQICQLGG